MKKFYIITLSILVLTIISLLTYILYPKEEYITKEKEEVTINEVVNKIYVDVKGEVINPNVYEVTEDLIIKDVIDLAGGFTENAYLLSVNLSKRVSSEMVIYIPSKLDITASDNILNDIAVDENALKTNTFVEESTEANNLVNINTATLEEFTTLNGIGESKANAILEYRNIHGNFTSIEEIKNVTGIGESTYENIKNNITV